MGRVEDYSSDKNFSSVLNRLNRGSPRNDRFKDLSRSVKSNFSSETVQKKNSTDRLPQTKVEEIVSGTVKDIKEFEMESLSTDAIMQILEVEKDNKNRKTAKKHLNKVLERKNGSQEVQDQKSSENSYSQDDLSRRELIDHLEDHISQSNLMQLTKSELKNLKKGRDKRERLLNQMMDKGFDEERLRKLSTSDLEKTVQYL